ncbi:alpha/beta hydrolase [Vibrio fluvialis]|nr:alpha/beta hydrolase [Vibrio fluvialis]MBL4288691.1 alpha/beta hydrolase [Vibrio fluvialis]MBL4292855.1 alpha/beta hydrolase [Vibrio fluvialis]
MALRYCDYPQLPSTTLNYPLDPKGDFIQKEWAPNPGDMDENMLSKLRQEAAAMPQDAWVGTIKGLEIMDWSLAARHISVPTLIMWGDQDQLMQEEQNTELQQAIPNAKMIVYEGLGHSMFWQQPERFAKDLMSFING